jgi:hypothetical protein
MPFQNSIMAGPNLDRPLMQSPNFSVEDQTGWAIYRNGDAYFFNVTATGQVAANSVIVSGAGDGVFIYDGTPGPGTLVIAAAAASGTDQYGNAYTGPGIAISAPGPGGGKNEIQIRPDLNAVLIYAA